MDPVLELQGAIVARLRAFADVTDIVAQRSYDEPPTDSRGLVTAALPYISIGPSSYDSDDADCIVGGEVMIQIDAWSIYPGKTEVRKIAGAIRRAFREYEFSLTTNALVTFDHLRTDYLRDGNIHHASVRFAAFVEEP